MIDAVLTFAAVAATTAFVCTCVKEDEGPRLYEGTARMLGLMAAGIAGFAVVVQGFTWLAAR